jgi:precorrin-6A/cobalt-precorrin-6A reductase
MKILILGGTGEAVSLAENLAARPGVELMTSLAGRTRAPHAVAGGLRVGGFGGAVAMADYLRLERFDLVIDATHPFARQISANAAAACEAADVRRLQLFRPAWRPAPGDRWIDVADGRSAASAISEGGYARVFLATGRQELPAFAALPEVWFLVRLVDAPELPLALVDYDAIAGRGPFVEADETDLLKQYEIDAIVAKNAGGTGSWPKLAAARALGIPVVMIRRPAPPDGDWLDSVDDVLRRIPRAADVG